MSYGIDRLVAEIRALGYAEVDVVRLPQPGTTSREFAVIRNYEVAIGRFAGRVISLGLEATPDFPRSVASAIHVSAEPQLLEKGRVENVRNIIDSPLGSEWRYWSHNFNWAGEREKSAARWLAQINRIFDQA